MATQPWFFLGLILGIVCHEFGHFLAALAGSIPVRLVSVGTGPVLLSGRIRETTFELRLLPLSGFVAPYPAFGYRRFPSALFTLGGILGNVALIGFVLALGIAGIVPQRAAPAVGAIVVTQLFLIVFSVIPMRFAGQANDGLSFVRLLRWRGGDVALLDSLYATMLGRYGAAGEMQLARSAASSRVIYHLTRPDRWTSPVGQRDAREALLRELDRGPLRREEELLVLDALATDGLIFGEAPERLEQWSARAFELAPEVRTLRGTRGAILVELGRYEEGKKMLEPLATAQDEDVFDALMNRAYLARAERGLGNAEAVRHWAVAARQTTDSLAQLPALAAWFARLEIEDACLPLAAKTA